VFTKIFPIITTADLSAALAFYRDLLGASVSYEFPGPDGEPGYVGLELGATHLGSRATRRSPRRQTPASACGSTPTTATRPSSACAAAV
jgi:catechol 2,3-dioxygenase-like lactoylglutathione lyase family enzyme